MLRFAVVLSALAIAHCHRVHHDDQILDEGWIEVENHLDNHILVEKPIIEESVEFINDGSYKGVAYWRPQTKTFTLRHMEAVRAPRHMEAVRAPRHMEAVRAPRHMEAERAPRHMEAVRAPRYVESWRVDRPVGAVKPLPY